MCDLFIIFFTEFVIVFVINGFIYLFAYYSLTFMYVYIFLIICDHLHDLCLFLFVCTTSANQMRL